MNATRILVSAVALLGASALQPAVAQGFQRGAPGVVLTRSCAYPNGWNSTDFDREINGIPEGRHHVCVTRVPRMLVGPAAY